MFLWVLKIQIPAQNLKGLAFGFIEKCQFAAQTGLNSIFLGRKAQILDWLHIIVWYISFYRFLKNQISAQNPKVVTFGFTEKHHFAIKTDQNSIFLIRKAHIPDRLHIMVLYISFYGFKNSNFGSKSKGVILRFYQKNVSL
jgi:hypothetical protein